MLTLSGGDPAGKHIYNRGSANGKRVQCNMGAKNHGVIMPDANKEYTINQLVGAAFGAAGQRCMALTTAVMVGDSQARCETQKGKKCHPCRHAVVQLSFSWIPKGSKETDHIPLIYGGWKS